MKVLVKEVKRVFDDFFKIDKATLQYEKFDGSLSKESYRLNFNRGHSVAVLLYNPEDKTLIFTRQFRFPAFVGAPEHAWILEIVAGMLEPDESPEATVVREALEETGYRISDPQFIYEFFVSPGGTSEKIFLYFATVFSSARESAGGGIVEEGEDIRVEHIPVKQALSMMNNGEICDAKTIIALQWFEKNMDYL